MINNVKMHLKVIRIISGSYWFGTVSSVGV
jgi:hypothetical protein